jgi:hypothetical protein
MTRTTGAGQATRGDDEARPPQRDRRRTRLGWLAAAVVGGASALAVVALWRQAAPVVAASFRAKLTPELREALATLNDAGLSGPPDGLVAVSYEFCIPATPRHEAEVRRIDPTLEVYPGSRGRIACTPEQALCIGSTHQPRHRAVLERLARLEYVTRISRSFAE